jgi:hypothetical protein
MSLFQIILVSTLLVLIYVNNIFIFSYFQIVFLIIFTVCVCYIENIKFNVNSYNFFYFNLQ